LAYDHRFDGPGIQALERLLHDRRMKRVWEDLRQETVLLGASKPLTQDEAPGAVYGLAFCVGADKRQTVTEQEAAAYWKNPPANPFRELADEIANLRSPDPRVHADVMAFLRGAQVWDARHAQAIAPGDPTMVRRHRADRTVQGVARSISEGLREIYGKKLEKTSATLCNVALALQPPNAATPDMI
jgi:hypothetical protein